MSLVGREMIPLTQKLGPYICLTSISDETHDILLSVCNKIRKDKKLKKDNDYRHRLAGNLKEEYNYDNAFTTKQKEIVYEELLWLTSNYTKQASEYHKKKYACEPHEIHLQEPLWINYMKPGDYNPPHIHGGDYSFVFFLDVPKEIHEEKKNFKGTHSGPGSLAFMYGQVAKPMWASVEKVVHPKSGDFFMFPAMLYHTVSPFKSNVTRISISGNLNIINRDDLPQGYF